MTVDETKENVLRFAMGAIHRLSFYTEHKRVYIINIKFTLNISTCIHYNKSINIKGKQLYIGITQVYYHSNNK